MTTKIILIRHGQSLGNAKQVLLGHTDLDLTELGYRQAEATAKALAEERIDVIYSSDLIRAMNTARPHGLLHGLDVIPDSQLREIYLGDWENLSCFEVMERFGERAYKVDWSENFGTFVMPNGEGAWEAGERFLREVERIAKENEGKTILVVAHAAVIRSFFGHISELTPETMSDIIPYPTNASYSIVYFDGERIAPGEYSIDEHLTEVGITRVEKLK